MFTMDAMMKTDEPHQEERAKARKIGPGRIAVEAHRSVGRGGDKEHARNRIPGEYQEDAPQ